MSDIELDEIEIFFVLKDVVVIVIYGVEGVNGVVLVIIKCGCVEKVKIFFKIEYIILLFICFFEFVGFVDYFSLYNEVLCNDGEGLQFLDELIVYYCNNDDLDLYFNINWIDEFFWKNIFSYCYIFNVCGGIEKVKYFVLGVYYNESGLFKNRLNGIYDINIGIDCFNLCLNIDMVVFFIIIVGVDFVM